MANEYDFPVVSHTQSVFKASFQGCANALQRLLLLIGSPE